MITNNRNNGRLLKYRENHLSLRYSIEIYQADVKIIYIRHNFNGAANILKDKNQYFKVNCTYHTRGTIVPSMLYYYDCI